MSIKNQDDSHLLDILLENREDEVIDDIDEETRTRLNELRKVLSTLREAANMNHTGLSKMQMDEVLARFKQQDRISGPEVSPRGRIRFLHKKPLSWVAAVLFLVVLGVSIFGPWTGPDEVYAGVFGGINLIRDGEQIQSDSHQLKILPGDTIVTTSGGMVDIRPGLFIRIGMDTKLVCLQIADPEIVLDLKSGLFRCESIPAHHELTLRVASAKITVNDAARDSAFTLQFFGRGDDQLVVDHGSVEIRCQGRVARITPESGAFSLARFDPTSYRSFPSFEGKIDLEPCCRRAGEVHEHSRTFPVQTDPVSALKLAAKENVPILVSREDGPCLASCFTCCCFVKFNTKQQDSLCGLIWLILHPARHPDALNRYNLEDDQNSLVILDNEGTVLDRVRVMEHSKAYGTILDFINSGKKACRKDCQGEDK